MLTKSLIDERNYLKLQNERLESQNLTLTNEIKQLQFIQEDIDNSQEENVKLRKENKQLYIRNFQLEDLETNLKQIEKAKREMDDYIKILEIEKEEAYTRCCSLQEMVQHENYKYSNTKKQLNEKDRELTILKKKIEELTHTISNNTKTITLKENQNCESKFTTNCSISNSNNKFLHNNYESSSSLSSLCPDLNDLEENENDNDKQFSLNITCPLIVEKMVGHPPPKAKNDIYKDYFILTFQALKLNSENHEPFLSLDKEKMYEEILTNNIPFHKVKIQF